ncbi:MAG: D-alanine--D-alanine ligase [Planctomycetota bacterium]
MRKLRVHVLMHEDFVPPANLGGYEATQISTWKTEFDVLTGLGNLGHDARPLGVQNDLGVIRSALSEFRPHVVFNLLEEFHGVSLYDQHVISYLELLRQPYTGCNPRGLMLSHDKALSKKLLMYHRIPVPRFQVFQQGRKIQRVKRLEFPVLVKSMTEHASMGIAQASVVNSDDKLAERVRFIHEQIGTDAIAEQYIDGREMYVCVLGNQRLQTLPLMELEFGNMPDSSHRIATEKLKRDVEYQKKLGVKLSHPSDVPAELERQMVSLSKRVYRTLGLSGYARMDFRVSPEGRPFLLEANANADVAYGEELAEAAELVGVSYEALLQRILSLGLSYRPLWRG